MSDIIQALSKMHIFRSIASHDLQRLIDQCDTQNYQRGQVICKQGDQAQNALILVSGRLEVSVQTGSSIRHVGEVHPGEIFGEQGLFHSNGTRNATVIANRDSICLVLTPRIMRISADSSASVALEKHLIATMARRIRATNLVIQKSWKEAQLEEDKHKQKIEQKKEKEVAPEKPASLLSRLRSIFGGGKG